MSEPSHGPFHVHPAVAVGLFVLGFGTHALLFARHPPAQRRMPVTVSGIDGGVPLSALAPPLVGPGSPPAGDGGPPVVLANVDLSGPPGAELTRLLSAAPHGSPAWFVVPSGNATAAARAEQLRAIFSRAGWESHPLEHSSAVRFAGVAVYAAAAPPDYVHLVARSMRAIGLSTTFMTDYRTSCNAQAVDGGSACIALAPDESFVVAVGPQR